MTKSNRILSLATAGVFSAGLAASNPAFAADPLEEAILQDPPVKSQTASTPAPVTCILTGAAELGPVCAQDPSTLQTPSLLPAELGPVPAPVDDSVSRSPSPPFSGTVQAAPKEDSNLNYLLAALSIAGTVAAGGFVLHAARSRREGSENKKGPAVTSSPRSQEPYGVAPVRPAAVPPLRSRPASVTPDTERDDFLNPANPASPLSPLNAASPLSSGYWPSAGVPVGGGGVIGGDDGGNCGGYDGGGGGCDISRVQRIRSVAGINSVLEP
jgi:hypothetical protein